jgi:hypothetical protein
MTGTKLEIDQFFKTFEDLIQPFLLELIFGTDETMVKRSNVDGWDCPKRRRFLYQERIGQLSWPRQ